MEVLGCSDIGVTVGMLGSQWRYWVIVVILGSQWGCWGHKDSVHRTVKNPRVAEHSWGSHSH